MRDNYDTVHRSGTFTPPDLKLEAGIEGQLRSYGLKDHEIELLMDKYVANLSYEDIADKQGYTDRKHVWRLLDELTNRLKKSDAFKQMLLRRTK